MLGEYPDMKNIFLWNKYVIANIAMHINMTGRQIIVVDAQIIF